MDNHEVTKALWDEICNWAVAHRYRFDNGGCGKAPNHPVHHISWYDAVKWCNARSEMEGRVPAYYTSAAHLTVYRAGQTDVQNDWVNWNRGYRLPTEAEWENAATGDAGGWGFWSDANTIRHSPNHYVYQPCHDLCPTSRCHPAFATGDVACTSPMGNSATSGNGVHNMAEYVIEWCWDRYGPYSSSPDSDPRGPASGLYRVLRGGPWVNLANRVWCAYRNFSRPDNRDNKTSFRCVLVGVP